MLKRYSAGQADYDFEITFLPHIHTPILYAYTLHKFLLRTIFGKRKNRVLKFFLFPVQVVNKVTEKVYNKLLFCNLLQRNQKCGTSFSLKMKAALNWLAG